MATKQESSLQQNFALVIAQNQTESADSELAVSQEFNTRKFFDVSFPEIRFHFLLAKDTHKHYDQGNLYITTDLTAQQAEKIGIAWVNMLLGSSVIALMSEAAHERNTDIPGFLQFTPLTSPDGIHVDYLIET